MIFKKILKKLRKLIFGGKFLQDQRLSVAMYLRCFMSGYLLAIIIIALSTLYQVRKRIAPFDHLHKNLLRKMSLIAFSHTFVFTMLLAWQTLNSFVVYASFIELLMIVSDMVGQFYFHKKNFKFYIEFESQEVTKHFIYL